MKRQVLILALIGLGMLLISCSDDNPTSPADDSDGPIVLSMNIYVGQTRVPVDQELVIFFDREMDPGSIEDAVTLSRGFVTGYDWYNERTLQVSHTAWTTGTQVTATVGGELTDVDGNALDPLYEVTFWTETTEVLVLDHTPATDEEGVLQNAPVEILFTQYMNMTTLSTGIVVTTPDRTIHSFQVSNSYSTHFLLSFDSPLPAGTDVTVELDTTCGDYSGHYLTAPVVFTFTTGHDMDTSPPHIVSWEPANGSTVPADLSFLRVTFDKPIARNTFNVAVSDLIFALSRELSMAQSVWSENSTILTIPLHTPLPAGVALEMGYDIYLDIYGNESEASFTYELTVEGVPDHYPLSEMFALVFEGTWSDDPTKSGGDVIEIVTFEDLGGGEFLRKFTDTPGVDPIEWDYMTKTESGILFRGFRLEDGGPPEDYFFDPFISYLHHPLVTETWSGSSTFTSLTETGEVEWSIEVLDGVEDVIWNTKKGHAGLLAKITTPPAYFWKDCRTVVLSHETYEGSTLASSGTRTMTYAPGFGLIAVDTYELDASSGDEYREWLELEGLELATTPW